MAVGDLRSTQFALQAQPGAGPRCRVAQCVCEELGEPEQHGPKHLESAPVIFLEIVPAQIAWRTRLLLGLKVRVILPVMECTGIYLQLSFHQSRAGGRCPWQGMRCLPYPRMSKSRVQIFVADAFRSNSLEELATLAAPTCKSTRIPKGEFVPFDAETKRSLIEEAYASGVNAIQPGNIEDILPLTNFQELCVETLDAYRQDCNYLRLFLGPEVDLRKLERACNAAIENIPLLRSCFLPLHGKHRQVVLEQNPTAQISTVDVDLAQFDKFFDEVCLRDIETLSATSLPFRFFIVRHGKAKGVILITRISHCQYDGISLQSFLTALVQVYQTGISSAFGPNFSIFFSYASRQRSKSIAYWRDVLQGARLTQLSSSVHPETAALREEAKTIKLEAQVDISLLPANITAATLASSAWAVVLSRVTGSTDVVFRHLVSGRKAPIDGIETMAGPCVNYIPVRVRLSDVRTTGDLLRGVQALFVSVGDADTLGFQHVIDHCTPWPGGSKFHSTVQHQNVDEAPEIGTANARPRLGHFKRSDVVPRSWMSVSYPQDGGYLKINLFSNTHIASRGAVNQILARVTKAIAILSSGGDQPLSEAIIAITSLDN